jgi:hypothetical protein
MNNVELRKPKFKFCKSGTVIVSCSGSGHRCWYRNRTEAEIEGCLRDFCHNCDRREPDCEPSLGESMKLEKLK